MLARTGEAAICVQRGALPHTAETEYRRRGPCRRRAGGPEAAAAPDAFYTRPGQLPATPGSVVNTQPMCASDPARHHHCEPFRSGDDRWLRPGQCRHLSTRSAGRQTPRRLHFHLTWAGRAGASRRHRNPDHKVTTSTLCPAGRIVRNVHTCSGAGCFTSVREIIHTITGRPATTPSSQSRTTPDPRHAQAGHYPDFSGDSFARVLRGDRSGISTADNATPRRTRSTVQLVD